MEAAAGRLLYFAYGSNLCAHRLRERAPSCRALALARLPGHRLSFHKIGRDGSAKCDARQTDDLAVCVHGVIYDIAETERPVLDRAEDLGRGYDAHQARLQTSRGGLNALTYRARDEMIDSRLLPFSWYHAFVLRGAREHGLPRDYIAAIAAVATIEDPDRERDRLNRRIIAGQG